MFPLGAPVFVDEYPRYMGWGIRVYAPGDADKLPVRLESGSVWHYRLENCRLNAQTPIPAWIKKELEERNRPATTRTNPAAYEFRKEPTPDSRV